MNVRKFEKISKFLSILLKLVSGFIVLGLIGLILLLIFKRNNLTMSIPTPSFPINSVSGDVPDSAKFIAGVIVAIPSMLIYFYAFFRGSQFFNNLSKGETPFSISNYKILKEIGLIVAITSFIFPLIYSLVATLLTPNGYYLIVGIDVETIIGLMIYCMAEVIRYGVNLQELSDKTVWLGGINMAIVVRLDRVMADRKILLKDLADEVGITNVNLSKLKNANVTAIRFETLNAICKALKCQPGDILEYEED